MHQEPEYTNHIAALVFAPDASKAKSIAARRTDLGDFHIFELRARRCPENDSASVTEPREASAHEYRNGGFSEEGEPSCMHCGKASFGLDEYAVCDECGACAECGCDLACRLTPEVSCRGEAAINSSDSL